MSPALRTSGRRKRDRPDSTAPGAVAGFLFQFERALARLAEAKTYDVEVGIETLDDITVREGADQLLLEANKHTIADVPLTDRSYALWHTLHLWALSGHDHAKLYLVTNRTLTGDLLHALAADGHERPAPAELVRLLKAAVARPSAAGKRTLTPTKLNQAIAGVLAVSDQTLRHLLERVRIIGGDEASRPTHASLAAQLGIPREYDAAFVLTQVLGWLVTGAAAAWREKRLAWFTRATCLTICDAALHRAARRRILPRPSRELAIAESDRARARDCVFVDHLALIDAAPDDVEQAVEHYLQFGIELHRLVDEGGVPPDEWQDRGERLVARWKNIQRRTIRACAGQQPAIVGLRILEQTTYDHRERICGEECDELYMTSGHYHRLVDDARVWWLPFIGGHDAH